MKRKKLHPYSDKFESLQIVNPFYITLQPKIKYARTKGVVKETVNFGDVMVDLDKKGRVVGVEFLQDGFI